MNADTILGPLRVCYGLEAMHTAYYIHVQYYMYCT